jgi:hypothetical protein
MGRRRPRGDRRLAGAHLHQDSTGVSDQVEANEFFGLSLAGADFNNDGYADLAVGVPGNRVLGVDIGTVHILYGTNIGVTQANDD